MKRIFAAALALSLMTGSVIAEARDHDRNDRGRHSRHEGRDWDKHHDRHQAREHRRDTRERHARVEWRDQRHWQSRHDDRRVYAPSYRASRFHVGHYHRPVGYRHSTWHRGARLPAAYYGPRYIVHDYDTYQLHRPPHGHHWVRIDNDVVLAAIATGVVVSVVNGIFY